MMLLKKRYTYQGRTQYFYNRHCHLKLEVEIVLRHESFPLCACESHCHSQVKSTALTAKTTMVGRRIRSDKMSRIMVTRVKRTVKTTAKTTRVKGLLDGIYRLLHKKSTIHSSC
jgi:hypothetical protein